MKNRYLGFGIFLVTVGLIWFLAVIGVIDWWTFIASVIKLWPLIIITIGVRIIFRRNDIVRIATWLVYLAIIFSYGYFAGDRVENNSNLPATQVSIDKPAETLSGELKVALGGVRVNVGAEDIKLFTAGSSEPEIRHTLDYTNGNERASILFERNHYINIIPFSATKQLKVNLNKDVVWDTVFQAGAITGKIDLSELKVKNVDIDVGASNLDIDLSDKNDITNVDIDGGVSKIKLNIPRTSGVRVKMDGGLTTSNLSSLDWNKGDGYYTSPNYSSAASKIDIDVDMGVSNFDIEWQE